MAILQWTKEEAREFLVRYHYLNLETPLKGRDAIKTIFNRIQSIQYDPLDVIGRNSDLVLQSRIQDYKKKWLHDALYKERYLIDGWDKMMSIYRTSDFPYFTFVREHQSQNAVQYHHVHGIAHAKDYSKQVLKQIAEKGPLYSREIDIEDVEESRWKHGKLSSVTLDYLFNSGQIVVFNKTSAQKQFELTEKLICTNDIELSEEEFTEWYLMRRIASQGLVWNKSSVSWTGFQINNKATRQIYINRLLSSHILTQIEIEDVKEPCYVFTSSLQNDTKLSKSISFIAPLDNLIWDRSLIKTIFDFEYTWEVYTPTKKRKYGYYVLPILYGSQFIGRIEFEHQRKNNPLVVKHIWFEDGISLTKPLEKALEKAFVKLQKYLSATEIVRKDKEG